jgi:glycine cleavage system H protein
MRAGVISYRLCDRGFDCDHCMLDAALHGHETQATWAPGDWGPSGYRLFPQDRQFSAAHTWAQSVSREAVRLGVDALAAWLIGKLVRVTLPEVGAWAKRGEPIATLSALGGQVVISAPLDGRVRARNDLLPSCPELVTAAPYGAGWLVDIDLSVEEQRKQLPCLLCGPDAEQESRGQLHRFHRRVDDLMATRVPRVGLTAADGGQPVTDPQAILGSTLYFKLVQELLA